MCTLGGGRHVSARSNTYKGLVRQVDVAGSECVFLHVTERLQGCGQAKAPEAQQCDPEVLLQGGWDRCVRAVHGQQTPLCLLCAGCASHRTACLIVLLRLQMVIHRCTEDHSLTYGFACNLVPYHRTLDMPSWQQRLHSEGLLAGCP